MNTEKNFQTKNKYDLLDAFKCFFFLIIVTAGVSIIMQIVANIVASSTGRTYEQVVSGDVFQIITYIISPVVFIIY